MERLLLIVAVSILFSCGSKKKNNTVVPYPRNPNIVQVDTAPRKKLTVPIHYDKYRVDTISGKRAPINYSSNQTARVYRSAITWSVEQFGMNFAGHYNLARWGCGTSCVNGAITDMQTGLVYNIPSASLGYEFRRYSRLLVLNPPDSSGYYENCSYCEPELWVWNENKKKFDRQN